MELVIQPKTVSLVQTIAVVANGAATTLAATAKRAPRVQKIADFVRHAAMANAEWGKPAQRVQSIVGYAIYVVTTGAQTPKHAPVALKTAASATPVETDSAGLMMVKTA